jgi:hypothetical protein
MLEATPPTLTNILAPQMSSSQGSGSIGRGRGSLPPGRGVTRENRGRGGATSSFSTSVSYRPNVLTS